MINIAIDGPAGAGKSYLARTVANRLGYIYVDTGALYRTIALSVLKNGIDPADKDAVTASLAGISVSLSYAEDGTQRVYLNHVDVSDEIRTPEISMTASKVSSIPEVRAFLLGIQKEMAATKNVVMDGRDIGTVILPNAQVKIFLCASEHARAQRRYLELKAKGIDTTVDAIKAEMKIRDEQDRKREVAPAVAAEDAVILDNSDLDREGTVDAALAIIREKLS